MCESCQLCKHHSSMYPFCTASPSNHLFSVIIIDYYSLRVAILIEHCTHVLSILAIIKKNQYPKFIYTQKNSIPKSLLAIHTCEEVILYISMTHIIIPLPSRYNFFLPQLLPLRCLLLHLVAFWLPLSSMRIFM